MSLVTGRIYLAEEDENKFIETSNFRFVSTMDEFEEKRNRLNQR